MKKQSDKMTEIIMTYCRIDNIPHTIEVFSDSTLSPEIEQRAKLVGYSIIHYEQKYPWKVQHQKTEIGIKLMGGVLEWVKNYINS